MASVWQQNECGTPRRHQARGKPWPGWYSKSKWGVGACCSFFLLAQVAHRETRQHPQPLLVSPWQKLQVLPREQLLGGAGGGGVLFCFGFPDPRFSRLVHCLGAFGPRYSCQGNSTSPRWFQQKPQRYICWTILDHLGTTPGLSGFQFGSERCSFQVGRFIGAGLRACKMACWQDFFVRRSGLRASFRFSVAKQ